MTINLDDPRKFVQLRDQAHEVAMNMLRPIRASTTPPSTRTPRSSTSSPR